MSGHRNYHPKRKNSIGINTQKSNYTNDQVRFDDDGYNDLAFAIVERAVEDYKSLIMKKRCPITDSQITQIKKFLYSEWCYSLCELENNIWDSFLKEQDSIKNRRT